jgi:hypothetical protein
MPEGKQLNIKLTPGEILITAGALVALIFSFFDFFGASFGSGISAWGDGLLPIATIIVWFCVIMGVQVVLTKLANLDLGPGIAGFTWPQIHLALGFFAVVDAFAFLIVKRGAYDIGIGLIFILIGAAACFAGAIVLNNERSGSKA